MKIKFVAVLLTTCLAAQICVAADPVVLNLWPGKAPGETKEFPPEADTAKADGAAMIVAPGGGFHILAYDLEGTEVAEWLNTIGVTAIVLKYRVPARDREGVRWREAVQDGQRAMSLVRSKAAELGIKPDRIGMMGFSAGGETAALTSLLKEKQCPEVDAVDNVSHRPDFVGLIYPGGLVPKGGTKLGDHVKVTDKAPPFFFAHANDDRVTPLSSALLYVELKKAGVPAELHIYERGGHGYGLRKTRDAVTKWPTRMKTWMEAQGLLKKK